jgi:hypothetical protein
VLAAICGGGLWKVLGLLAVRPELATAITAAAMLLTLFVGLDPWQRPGGTRPSPVPPNPADDNPSANPLAYLPNKGD